MKMLKQGKYFVFTLNNYTPEEEENLGKVECLYMIYGHEIAPDTLTPHLQGYVQFEERRTPTYMKRINKRIHWENAKGNYEQNHKYCSKGENIIERGTPILAQKGVRNDLKAIKKSVLEGTMIDTLSICDNYQQIRYAEKLYEYKPLSTEYKKKEVYWFYGPTGTGKTRAAYDMIKEKGLAFWRSNVSGAQWFNGYIGEPIALIEELRAGKWPYGTMLELLDGYEMKVPVKGAYTIWCPSIIIITSPKSPKDAYGGQLEFGDGNIDQLERRITEIREFSAPMEDFDWEAYNVRMANINKQN